VGERSREKRGWLQQHHPKKATKKPEGEGEEACRPRAARMGEKGKRKGGSGKRPPET